MTTAIKRRRGTTLQHATFTGLEGEVTVDTTKDTLVVHDGATAGGFALLREDLSNNTNVVTTTNTKTLTNKTFGDNPTFSAGTANGVVYLNGSKVATTGSALTFDGSMLSVSNIDSVQATFKSLNQSSRVYITCADTGQSQLHFGGATNPSKGQFSYSDNADVFLWYLNSGSEQMRLTSTGLGIGTSTITEKLNTYKSSGNVRHLIESGSASSVAVSTVYKTANRTWEVGQSPGLGNNTFTIYDATADAVRVNIDTAGNLGLGVTPSAWSYGIKVFEFGTKGGVAAAPSDVNFVYNTYYNGSNRYRTSDYANNFQMTGGAFKWYTAPSGTAGNAISFTQAMTLDASGNLGIGTSSPVAFGAGYVNAQVNGTTGSFLNLSVNGTRTGYMYADVNGVELGSVTNTFTRIMTNNTERMRIDSSGNVGIGIATPGAKLNVSATASGLGQALFFFNGTSVNYTDVDTNIFRNAAGTERMRIDSSGNLLVGTASTWGALVNINATANGIRLRNVSAAGTPYMIAFDWGAANVGSIASNSTSTSYLTSSDYRLKENIQPMQNALDAVAQLNPVRYTWKADGSDGQGFIAHELQAVVPDCVTGEKDAVDEEGKPVYQGVDTSFLVATLTAAIKELKAEVDSLKSQLENK